MIIPPEWMKDNKIYSPKDIDILCDKVKTVSTFCGETNKYLNIPISFDTETTSFYDKDGEKTAIVYVWMLGIAGLVIMGRTMEEWIYTYTRLTKNFRTCGKRRILIYIHNLSFDFQFIRKYHTFTRVFATDKYEPLYALTNEGIEFRCSYRLSGYSLNTIGKNLMFHHVEKLIGDLDYRQLRHSKTPLTDEEKLYCVNDVKIVCAYIDELIDRNGGLITNLPLTKTGFVREYCRNECFKDRYYKWIIHEMKLNADEFNLCKNAFQGGYTHANANWVDETISDVTSLDITSSYPSVMVAEKYPMESPQHIEITSYEQMKEYIQNYCCIFTITIDGIKPRHYFDFYISASKCEIRGKRILSNGRIVSAERIQTTITNIDFEIIEYMYEWENIYISDFIYFKRDYLPTPFIESLLHLYQQKTELKGVEGKEIEYAVIKENQNSFYGMTVTSPIKPIINYIEEWEPAIIPDLETEIQRYNKNYRRFLYYPWGVFVTAYARRNIWGAIIECGNDHIYCDTDSEKCINYSTHAEWFTRYNENVLLKHKTACKVHGIDISLCTPKNRKGEIKQLGAFEIDGIYDQFKTLGAKRYLYKTDSKFGITVAGMNKITGLQYMQENFSDVFEGFADGLIIPPEYSGRLIHTYIDERRTGTLIDMYGNPAKYDSLSGVHLEPATYTLGITGDFLRFIMQIKEGDEIE